MRNVTVAAAQMGPVAQTETRAAVVDRLIVMLEQAAGHGADLVVYPELALTTFFPRWHFEEDAELDAYYEREMPGPETAPLFAKAKQLGIGFSLGYAELTPDGRRFNTAILVGPDGALLGKYRKIHLPGHRENEPWRAFQHLEKRYFLPGNLGFRVFDGFGGRVGMCICNDRRWPETYRVMGLQGVEMILLGYNTPIHNPPAPEHDRLSWHHNTLVMQSAAYQNATFVVGVAKAGMEEGVHHMGGTQIIAPTGETIASAVTEGDEVIFAECDLGLCKSYRESVFAFERHREPDAYRLITGTKGCVSPEEAVLIDPALGHED
ncbi:N-carbamoyl-D-amino-acid hydrolase [Nisaea acidiphila]|uniref:N-carbamoyl-D-amino-acid hydrolase n=1 Tax=Nisaea acidiphila TaxID=1862145 RepID=A0A9J7AP67_9PROT|nr:N-carbamoyl-D-amino-acid hydrolase [Nisaea acidiphila]UUX48999.1 N-carbamoyl-D-amino-acid hydrolase [Nisaea acidiphila]